MSVQTFVGRNSDKNLKGEKSERRKDELTDLITLDEEQSSDKEKVVYRKGSDHSDKWHAENDIGVGDLTADISPIFVEKVANKSDYKIKGIKTTKLIG